MCKYLRRLWRRTDGGAAVEFGIVFPFFSILILAIVEYGMLPFQIMNVSYAAQVGAQYAMLNGYNVGNIQSAVTAASGIPAGSITVTEACGCASGTSLTSEVCRQPPVTCTDGQPAGTYVTVTVSQAYSPAAPGVNSPLTAATMVRVQ
ncbi:MAG: TadE/TadG family type IV pilus assembly protein [Acetobacteraceae bacterium]|jgi:Flp pilus assembly protein TadG